MLYLLQVHGALQLATATAATPAHSALHFSSLSAQLGTPGQSNYAAANSALDSVVQQQRNAGRAFASVLWGPWATGMAAQDPALLRRFQAAGLAVIKPAAGLHLLSVALASPASVPAAAVLAGSILWRRLLRGAGAAPGIFADFAPSTNRPGLALDPAQPYQAPAGATGLPGPGMPAAAAAAAPRGPAAAKQEAAAIQAEMLALVAGVAAGMLGAEVAPDQPLMEAGLDSLGEQRRCTAYSCTAPQDRMSRPGGLTGGWPMLCTVLLGCRGPPPARA